MAPIFFRSGCSNLADFQAAVDAQVPVGISVAITSTPALELAAQYLAAGGHVFADSGAFGAFRRGQCLDADDFERHLRICLTLARSAHPGHLHVVAPDVVGDQDATIALLRTYAGRLADIADTGAVVIIPLQKGALGLADFFAFAQSLLPGQPLSAGLPSNAQSLASDEVIDFVRGARPGRVHFLGAAYNLRFRTLLADVRAIAPGTQFTYDAAVIRSICSEIARTPERIQAAANEDLDAGVIDGTELSPLVNPDDPVAIHAFAQILGVTDEQAAHAVETEDPDAISWLEIAWEAYVDRYAQAQVSATWRTRALAAHPAFRADPDARPEQAVLAL